MKKITLFLALACFSLGQVFSQAKFKYGGFVKLDYMQTEYKNGDNGGSPLGDFHIPGFIPVGSDIATYENYFHMKESRFFFDLAGNTNEKKLRAYMEMDFMLSPGGDERVSNSYNPRIRHMYFEYDRWLFGQTWSTFMIVVIPEDLDFTGAAEGIVFQRQPLVRYTLPGENGNWQFALENPHFTITPDNSGGRITTRGGIPDAVVRKNFIPEWGSYSIAGIVRGINGFNANNDRIWTPGFGITAGGKINVREKDDIRFTLTAGQGLGRYLAINYINAAEYNPTDDNLNSIGSVNGYIAYLFHWTDKLKSSVNASAFWGSEDNTLASATSNRNAQSYSVNLLYAPAKPLLFGVEFMHAIRELQNGTKGSMNRLQLSAKYVFGYEHTTKP